MTQPLTIASIGSRDYPRLDEVSMLVDLLVQRLGPNWMLVSGGTGGVDEVAATTHTHLTRQESLVLESDWPRYTGHGKRNPAALIRNKAIIEAAQMVFAFKNPASKTDGTGNAIRHAYMIGRMHTVFNADQPDMTAVYFGLLRMAV